MDSSAPLQTVTAPVVVGCDRVTLPALLAALAEAAWPDADACPASHRYRDRGLGLLLVEIEAEPVDSVVRHLRGMGFAALAGPATPGLAPIWARHNGVCCYEPGRGISYPWTPVVRGPHDGLIELDPGSGFGSGRHPTTMMVLRKLTVAAENGQLEGGRVLDLGCGTGILGIAAAQAGAEVVGVDIAPAALAATADNIIRNGVGDRFIEVTDDLTAVTGPFDLILANIAAPVIVELAPGIRRLLGNEGSLIVSGLSPSQPSMVGAALAPLTQVWEAELDEWVALEFVAAQRR